MIIFTVIAGICLLGMTYLLIVPTLCQLYVESLRAKLYRIEDSIDALYERQDYLQDQMRSVEFTNNNIEYTNISKDLERLALEYCRILSRIEKLSWFLDSFIR